MASSDTKRQSLMGSAPDAVRYRKKPVVIEAIRLEQSAISRVLDFIGPRESMYHMPEAAGATCWWRQTFPNGDDQNPVIDLMIPTLEGWIAASDGDWIIRGVEGEIYPCKPSIFAASYELVADHEDCPICRADCAGADVQPMDCPYAR